VAENLSLQLLDLAGNKNPDIAGKAAKILRSVTSYGSLHLLHQPTLLAENNIVLQPSCLRVLNLLREAKDTERRLAFAATIWNLASVRMFDFSSSSNL
jgi:hypothetical protein